MSQPTEPMEASEAGPRIDRVVVGIGAATGLVMGLITSLVGLSPALEPLVWMVGYAVWLRVMVGRRSPSPLMTTVLASLASGVVVGLVQAVLLEPYRLANPWYAAYHGGDQLTVGAQMVVQGLGMGALFGVAVGLAARGLVGRVTAS
jgi:hypothetical protein